MSKLTYDLFFVRVMVMAFCRLVINLLKVLYDKVFEPLDAPGLTFWKKKILAYDCPL